MPSGRLKHIGSKRCDVAFTQRLSTCRPSTQPCFGSCHPVGASCCCSDSPSVWASSPMQYFLNQCSESLGGKLLSSNTRLFVGFQALKTVNSFRSAVLKMELCRDIRDSEQRDQHERHEYRGSSIFSRIRRTRPAVRVVIWSSCSMRGTRSSSR
jgi:hypothetical protein